MNIGVRSDDDAEAILYGVHNASAIQRRLPSAPAVPATATMNISATAAHGSAVAIGYGNDSNAMTFSGGIAGRMDILATGSYAQAIGISAGGLTLITEPVNNTMLVTAKATENDAIAQGISNVEADEFDFDWNIHAESEAKNAQALGAAASSIDQFTQNAKLTVSAEAALNAYAGGFVQNPYGKLNVSELFAGTLDVQAVGKTASAVGVESVLTLNDSCEMAAKINVSATAESEAMAYGFKNIIAAEISNDVKINAVSDSGLALAQGWQGTVDVLSGSLQVSAKGETDVRAYGFSENELTPSKGGTLGKISAVASVSVRAESTNTDQSSKSPVYAIGGQIKSSVDGTICVTAVVADSIQETHAAAVYGESLSVSGIVAANAATRTVAFTANDESTAVTLSISGAIFAGQSSATEQELIAMLKQPAQYRELLQTAKSNTLQSYSIYVYDENDQVTLVSGAVAYGDMEFAAGNNTLTISNGAFCYGNITAENGSLAINFVLDSEISSNAVISCDSAGAFAETTTAVNINVDKILSNGKYKLAEGISDAKGIITEISLQYK